ncbi:MAG: hypothetical protein LQ350_004307 [Teloschistes chrysophthalmus]|nr:MAG: hypothetical protein LQ350_004307 [Niorma chrysophthalma]
MPSDIATLKEHPFSTIDYMIMIAFTTEKLEVYLKEANEIAKGLENTHQLDSFTAIQCTFNDKATRKVDPSLVLAVRKDFNYYRDKKFINPPQWHELITFEEEVTDKINSENEAQKTFAEETLKTLQYGFDRAFYHAYDQDNLTMGSPAPVPTVIRWRNKQWPPLINELKSV